MAPRSLRPLRAVAAATAAYSTAITVRPALLAGPVGLTRLGVVPVGVAGLVRSIGTRDAALALALLVAPAGRAVRLLTAARVVSDAADALWFWNVAPAGQRAKVCGVAAGWALLEAGALALAER